MQNRSVLPLVAFVASSAFLSFNTFGAVSEDFDAIPNDTSYGVVSYNGFYADNSLVETVNSRSGKAIRMRNATGYFQYEGGDGNGKDGGVGTISFWYRAWDSDPTCEHDVEVNIDGAGWTLIGTINYNGTTYTEFSYDLNNASDNIIIRITRTAGERLLIDDFSITDYAGSCAPDAVTLVQQTNHYEKFSSGGDIYNNGGAEMGMWANFGSEQAVAWRDFRTDGSGGGDLRSLKPGDRFKIQVYGTAPNGDLGVSVNDGASTGSWANRHSNSRGYIQVSGGTGNDLYVTDANGTASWSGVKPNNSDVTFVFDVLSSAEFTANIEGQTPKYDRVMLNSPGTSDLIDGFSLYLSDDAGDVFWKQTTLITNLGYVLFGADNGTRNITGLITDGTDPSCEDPSPNELIKRGTGVVTLQHTANTYTKGTVIENGTLAVFADGSLGTAPASSSNNIEIWSTGTLRATNTFTLDSDRKIQLGNVNGPAISVDSGKTLTYAGVLGGNADWSKEGGGVLALTGTSSTNAGKVSIEAGTLRIVNDGSLGVMPGSPAEKVDVWNTGTFEADGTFSIDANRTITMGNINGPSFSVTAGNTLTYGGDITGNAVWNKVGAGTLKLTGSRTGGGDLLVNTGEFIENGTNTSMNVNAGTGTFVYGAGSLGALSITGQVSAGSASNTVGRLLATGLSLEDDGILQVNISAMTGTAGTDWDVISVGGGSGAYTVNATDGNDFIIALKGSPTFSSTTPYTNIIVDAGTASGFAANKFTVNTDEFSPSLDGGVFSVDAVGNDLRLIFTPSVFTPPTDIAFQGFDVGTNDNWNYTFSHGDDYVRVTDNTNATDVYALELTGSDNLDLDPTITFDNIDISGYSSVTLSVAFAVAGADADDDLYLDISYDNGATWNGAGSVKLVDGNSNKGLGFGGTDVDTVAANPYYVGISGQSQIKVRFRYDERFDADNSFDRYFIDDVHLTGVGGDTNVSFGALTYYADETNSTFTVPVNISSAADATVRVAIAGTAIAGGTDYSVNSTNIIFTSGGSTSSNLVFTMVDDTLAEGIEDIQLRLVNIQGARPAVDSYTTILVRDDDGFTFMSANLTAGTNEVSGAITLDDSAKRIIKRLRPDIVAMQEWVITNASYRQFVDEVLGPEYEFFVENEVGGSPIPNGIISRWPIVSSNEWNDSFVGARDHVHAEIDIPGPKNLNVISTHFKAGSGDASIRVNQAGELTNYIANAGFNADDYLIIGADLNLEDRNEAAYIILTNSVVTDDIPAHDQDGSLNTNLGRNNPYDHVLADSALDALHVNMIVGGYTYTGMVFDTEQFADHMLPALVNDTYTTNRTHLPVMKLFNLSTDAVPPTVTTTIASLTNVTTATTGGDVTDDGDAAVTNRGVVWSTSASPTIPGTASSDGTGTGSFVSTMNSLTAGETYYYRAYAQNEAGTGYGEEYTLDALCFTSVVQGLYASATNDVTFTATWDAFDGAEGYVIDVSTNESFGGGGGGNPTLLHVDFETAGDGYTPSTTTGSGDIDVFNRTDVANGSNDGFYWAVEDLPVTDPTITLDSVDITGVTEFDFSIDFLTPNTADWDNSDSLLIKYSINGGSFQNLMAIENDGSTFNTPAQLDSDFNGDGDGGLLPALVDGASAGVGSNFATFNTNGISVSGTGLVVRLEFYGLDATDEGIYLDNIIISNSAAAAGSPDFMPGYSNRAVSATSVSVTGLTTGVEYFYRVRATNAYCVSGDSGTATVTTIFISPAIDVIGDGNSITNGDNSPIVTDLTDFGGVGLVGSNIVHTFTITNDGTSSLTFDDVAVGGSHPGDFTISSQPGSPVAVGGSSTFTVTFNPSALGTRTATLYITNNVAADNPFIFDVQGTGVAAVISHGPTSLSATTILGSSPAADTFYVTNTGLGQLSYTITDDVTWLSVAPSSATVSETDNQAETVTYIVSGLVAGTSNATITITDANADNSPQTVTVTLTITNIPDPTAQSATPDGNELIDLAWTKRPDHDVMIVHNEGSDPSAPAQGTAYSPGDSVGGGTVIYKGSGATLEHIVSTGSDHYYDFYSINNDHYSLGVSYMTNTLVYALGEIVETFSYTNGANFGSGASENGGQGFTNEWQVGAETWEVNSGSMNVNTNYPNEVGNGAKLVNPGNGDLGFMTRGIAPFDSGTIYVSGLVRFQYSGNDKYTGIELTSNGTARAFFGEVRNEDKHPGIAASATANAWDVDTGYDMNDYATDSNNVYMIVARYNFSTRDLDMKVFFKTEVIPALEPSSWNASSTLAAGTMNMIDGIRLVGGSSDGGATLGDAFFDEIRVADSWAELIGQFPEPEIEIVGTNFTGIASGTTTTSSGNGTDFGSTLVTGGQIDQTFYITNSGLGMLIISGVTTSGTHAADFTVLDYPLAVYPGTLSNLTVRFDPSASGVRTAVVEVASDDSDEATYTFVVKGTGQVPPTVTTTIANPTNDTTATAGGNVTDEGFSAVTDRGVVWSTSINPTIPGTQSSDGTGSGSFVSTLTGLTPGATYYYRAFATNAAGVAYGAEYSLVAECFNGIVTGLYVSATNDTSFIAVWSNFFGASGYEVDVSTSSNFVEFSSGNYGVEVFTNVGGGTVSSYLTRNWESEGVQWTAYKSRTDQTIDGSDAVTLRDEASAYLISDTISGGIDELWITHQQQFSGSGGTFDIFVNSIKVATNVAIGTTVQTAVVQNIDVSGNFTIMVTNSGSVRVAFDNLTWTNVSGNIPSYVDGYEARSVASESVTVTGLTEGVEYFIRVRATNDTCVSDQSATSSVTTVTTYPGIGVSPTTISHTLTLGDTLASDSFGVTNVGTGVLAYEVSTNRSWITVSPVAGSVAAGTGQQHTNTYNLSGLNVGVTNATITITDSGGNATNGPLTIDVSITLTAIVEATSVTLTNDVNELVRLGWTKAPAYDVMIVHRQTNAPSAPAQGTAYSAGDAIGSDGSRVIYLGVGSTLEHVVEPGSINHYAFYSVNNAHYSEAVETNTTMGTYDAGVVVETFSYTNGTTVATYTTGGQGFSGAWTGDTGLFTNSLNSFANQDNYPSNAANKVVTRPAAGEDNAIIRSLDADYGDDVIYVSYILNYEFSGAPSDNKFAGLSLMDGATERLFVGEAGSADQTLGINTTTSGDSLTAGIGNDYIIILRYSWANGTADASRYKIGTDTVPSTEPGTWDVTLSIASNTVGTIDGIRLAAGADSGTPGQTYFDEIRVSTSWENLLGVTPSPVIYDWFASSSGSVNGDNGGTGWSNTWATGGDPSTFFIASSIDKAKSSYHEPQGNKIVMYGDVDDRDLSLSRNFLTPFNTGVVYFSWMMNYEFAGANKYAGMSLMDGSTELAFIGKVHDGSNGQLFGIASSSDNQTGGEAINASSNYVIVGKYDFSTRELSASHYEVTTNAIAEEPQGYWHVMSTQLSNHIQRISGIRFAVGADASLQIGDVYFDEIRVGTNFYEVARRDGESQSKEMTDGPTPRLLYVGTNYLTANNPQGALSDITVTDADLANSSEPLDIAVMWTNAFGVFLTNANSSILNFGSRNGRVSPNYDPVVLSGEDFQSIGADAVFTNFVGYDGGGTVTTYVHGAFNITNSTISNTYFITMSAENDNTLGGSFAAPNGGDDIPYYRALTINTALQFYVNDDDLDQPEFYEYTINGEGGFGDTNLTAGSIAIIGVNGSSVPADNERFSFVVLRPFPAGTEVRFTDRGWYAESNTWHRPSEFHTNSWVSLGNAAVGEVIELTLEDINNGGDQIVVYQYDGLTDADSDPDNVRFLYAVNLDPDNDGWDVDPIPNDNEHSGLYRGLTNGATAVSVPIGSYHANAYYTGSVVGTASDLLSWISDSNNWYVVPSGSSADIDITNYSFTVTGSGTIDWTLAAISDEQALLGGYRITNIAQDSYSGIVATNTSFASAPYFELFNTNNTSITSNQFPVTFANGENGLVTMVMDGPAGVYSEITLGTVSSHVYVADMDNDRVSDHLDDLFSMPVNIYDDDEDAPLVGSDLVTLMLNGTALDPTNGVELLAGWNFLGGNDVDFGSGTFSSNLANGTTANIGTSINLITNDTAISADMTVSGADNIGRYVAFEVDMTGHTNLILTMAARRSATGYNSNTVSYTVNGGAPVVFQQVWTPASDWALATFDFGSETVMNNATSVTIFITFGVDGVTGGGNNRFDNLQFNADIARYYEITDAMLTNVGASSPLEFSFNAYDTYSGLSRGTTDNGSNMTITVDGLYADNAADYDASKSSASTIAGDSTSTWSYASAIDYDMRGVLYADGRSNRLITATMADLDNDRYFDTLWESNSFFGKLRIIDDDPLPPTNANISFGGVTGNNRPFYVATNGVVSDASELIRGNYPRRSGSGTETIFAVTDHDLARSGTDNLQFVFGVVDAYSEVSRGTSGTTNTVMSISIGNAVTGNFANFNAALSSSSSGPGVIQSNFWTFADGFFNDDVINSLMAAESNVVAVTVPDNDNDRTNDAALLASQIFGTLEVYDDDISGPTMSIVDILGIDGGAILSTSFETSQGWPVSTAGFISSTNWTYTDSYGTWYASGAQYTTLQNKNTGTRRLGLLVDTNAPNEQYIQLPPVDNPGVLTVYAARFSGADTTLRVDRATGGSWTSVGQYVITNNQDDLFMDYAYDVNLSANDVTLRVVRVGSSGPQVSLDDISVSSSPQWISTNQLSLSWNAGVDDYSNLDYYSLVKPAVGTVTPSTTNDGVQLASNILSSVQSIQGEQGVITGFVFSVDDDNDRTGDAAMGNVISVVVKVDTNPPPAVAGFTASNDIFDATAKINLYWTPYGTEGEAAGRRDSDGVALSDFVSYRVYYTEQTFADPTYSDAYFDATNSVYTELGDYSTATLAIDGLIAGFTYHLALAGIDEAGNLGPMSDVAVITLETFGISDAFANEDHHTVIQWEGNELNYFDVIYADSTGYAAEVDTMWKLAQTIQGTQFIDEGGADFGSNETRVPPNQMNEGMMRFYRISPVNAWIPSGTRGGAASEEVVVAHLISLAQSNNFIGIGMSRWDENVTMQEFFGETRLASALDMVDATRINLYPASQTGDPDDTTLWLSSTGWLDQASGWANTNEIPFPHQGFTIFVPEQTNLLMVGRVPYTNTPMVSVVASQAYNVLSMNVPRPMKVSELGIRDYMTPGYNLNEADEIRIMQKGQNAPWGQPKSRVFLHTSGVFLNRSFGNAENYVIEADEAIILFTRGSVTNFPDLDWAGTNFYSKPQILISATITAAPSVSAASPIILNVTNAILRGTVNPNLLETETWIQYGTTTNYGTVLSSIVLPATNVPIIVTTNVYGLIPGARIHYQIVASNALGISRFGASSFVVGGGPTDMAYIPSNTFVMGGTTNAGHTESSTSYTEELPQHNVQINAIYMDTYEVSQELWESVYTWAVTNAYGFGSFGTNKTNGHPVVNIDWHDAITWCNARSEMEGLTPVYYTNTIAAANVYRRGDLHEAIGSSLVDWDADGYRLPTEAEWEHAARGGVSDARFSWASGNSDIISHTNANFDNSGAESYKFGTTGYHPTYNFGGTPYTAPVISFSANGYGLYNMAGNVSEWCWDYYGSAYYGSSPLSNPRGDTSGSRVHRGGSWAQNAVEVRTAKRASSPASGTSNEVGFRTVRKAPQ